MTSLSQPEFREKKAGAAYLCGLASQVIRRSREASRSRLQSIYKLLLFTGMVLLLQAISAILNAESHKQFDVSLVWLPNGLLIGVLICNPKRRWPSMLGIGLAIDILVNMALGGTIGTSLGYTALNATEILVASTLTYPYLHATGDLTKARQLKAFLLYAVLSAPMITALCATYYTHFHDGVSILNSLRVWFAADMLGIATITPMYLSYFHRVRFTSRSNTEVAVLFPLLLCVTFAVFRFSTYPALWLVLMMLLLLGVRLGFTASALGLLVVIAIGGYLTILGLGPLGRSSPQSLPNRMLAFQVFTAFTMIALYVTEVAMTANRNTKQGLADSEARLKALADDLEVRVDLRTRELQREIAEREVIQHELLNAKLLAEDANVAKSAFLANMSHELRTPLNAILGYSEMLQEDAELSGDAGAAEDLGRIQSAGRHLLSLINDVLDLSKIEAGRLQLFVQPASIQDIVTDVQATISPLAQKQNNQFSVQISGPATVVQVDVVKFKQCLLNLLSNACKFTQDGQISLHVSSSSDENGAMVKWAVSDNGIGISSENTKRLFEAFLQVDASATRRHDGTGLGLAISQRLAKLMGGWIEVETEVGCGSTFTIHIPAEPFHNDSIDSAEATIEWVEA